MKRKPRSNDSKREINRKLCKKFLTGKIGFDFNLARVKTGNRVEPELDRDSEFLPGMDRLPFHLKLRDGALGSQDGYRLFAAVGNPDDPVYLMGLFGFAGN